MFSYFTCTDDELLQHVINSTPAKISVAKKYHHDKGNFEIVARIEHARKRLKILRLDDVLLKLKGIK